MAGEHLGRRHNGRPEDLPESAKENLWIDQVNAVVWVEGEEIALSPQEYDILNYLYKYRGQLCTRQAIVREALGDAREDIWEKSRLNSAVSRVRLKIEQNTQSKYLTTVRSRGYKLEL